MRFPLAARNVWCRRFGTWKSGLPSRSFLSRCCRLPSRWRSRQFSSSRSARRCATRFAPRLCCRASGPSRRPASRRHFDLDIRTPVNEAGLDRGGDRTRLAEIAPRDLAARLEIAPIRQHAMHAHHVALAATRRVEQLKKAGARLATLNNDLIRRGNFKRVTVGAHFSRERFANFRLWHSSDD
jgi:hypothetical protein